MSKPKQAEWVEEWGAAFLTITNQSTWRDGKPVFYGHKYATVYNALQDVVGNLLSRQRAEIVEMMRKMKQYHNRRKHDCGAFDCEIEGYNQALTEVAGRIREGKNEC